MFLDDSIETVEEIGDERDDLLRGAVHTDCEEVGDVGEDYRAIRELF